MFRIRFHGRGGQGMKTASRILGTCFFKEGFEVQDAPRYGAERRGAPIFAYVRASNMPIYERGIIYNPDLIVVADDTLVTIPAANALAGADEQTVLLIHSDSASDEWRRQIQFPGTIITISIGENTPHKDVHLSGIFCTGAAACLTGKIRKETVEEAVKEELEAFGGRIVSKNSSTASAGYDRVADFWGILSEGVLEPISISKDSEWVDIPFEEANKTSPSIHAAANSEKNPTGLWRTRKPVIDYDRCKHCWWICSSFCPENAIQVSADGKPLIDYDHCKGCLICVAQCPSHANHSLQETGA